MKEIFVKIAPKDDPDNFYIDRLMNARIIVDLIFDCQDGDGYIISRIDMTNEEYEKLPEFCGF